MWNLNTVLKSKRIFLDVCSRLFNCRRIKASGANVPSDKRRNLPPRGLSQKHRGNTWPAAGRVGVGSNAAVKLSANLLPGGPFICGCNAAASLQAGKVKQAFWTVCFLVTHMMQPPAFSFFLLFLFHSSLNFQLVQLVQPLYFFSFSFVFQLGEICLMLVLLYSESGKELNKWARYCMT